ncbi:unnamed protein product [Cuscuta campestris]|uniref:Uncharacterized protein n=1 Tax=Cuscuta campestris TaxID=132261 RepID=A0A484M0M2_9ASTE|nr:unnamed protein product [Cuscuta campestris]
MKAQAMMRVWLKVPPGWRRRHICSPRAVTAVRFLLRSPLQSYPPASCLPPPLFSSIRSASPRHLSFRSGAVKQPADSIPRESSESDGKGGSDKANRGRNAKKREARRAVSWGIELAKCSPPQIKRILRVASLQEDVYDALMLVKRLGLDVREGKRRQFSYIGRLLRDVEPELMDELIKATYNGDHDQVRALSRSRTQSIEDFDESDYEDEEEDDDDAKDENIELADRWFDGLINKNIEVSNEIYSLREVEFDRQELRNLVRNVQSIELPLITEEGKEGEVDMAFLKAKKSLTRFLRRIAKQVLRAE